MKPPLTTSPSYVLMMRDLGYGPATRNDIAAALRISADRAGRLLSFAHKQKKVRVVGYEGRSRIFSISPGKDVPRPLRRHPRVLSYLKYLQKFADWPAGKHKFSKALGLSQEHSRRLLQRAHREGLLRIVGWRRQTGNPLPVYALGGGPDEPKPRALTWAERKRRWRQKHLDLARQIQRNYYARRLAASRVGSGSSPPRSGSIGVDA